MAVSTARQEGNGVSTDADSLAFLSKLQCVLTRVLYLIEQPLSVPVA